MHNELTFYLFIYFCLGSYRAKAKVNEMIVFFHIMRETCFLFVSYIIYEFILLNQHHLLKCILPLRFTATSESQKGVSYLVRQRQRLVVYFQHIVACSKHRWNGSPAFLHCTPSSLPLLLVCSVSSPHPRSLTWVRVENTGSHRWDSVCSADSLPKVPAAVIGHKPPFYYSNTHTFGAYTHMNTQRLSIYLSARFAPTMKMILSEP